MGSHPWPEDLESIWSLWKTEWFVLFLSKCSHINIISFSYHDCSIVVRGTVIWGRKDSDTRRELIWSIPSVEFVTLLLQLMRTDKRFELLFFEEFHQWLLSKVARNISLLIEDVIVLVALFVSSWIRPEYIRKKSIIVRLHFPINHIDVINTIQFLRYASMHGQILSIDDG